MHHCRQEYETTRFWVYAIYAPSKRCDAQSAISSVAYVACAELQASGILTQLHHVRLAVHPEPNID